MTGRGKRGIILTGMPGCGKSTCGVLVAKFLCLSFEDTDLSLQTREKLPLQKIIDQKGREYFAAAEEKTLLQTAVDGKCIATGGSAVYYEGAMERFKNGGFVVYLKISYGEMLKRIGDFSSRGILLGEGETLGDMFAFREALYEKYADIIIDCDGFSPAQTAQAIARAVRERGFEE